MESARGERVLENGGCQFRATHVPEIPVMGPSHVVTVSGSSMYSAAVDLFHWLADPIAITATAPAHATDIMMTLQPTPSARKENVDKF